MNVDLTADILISLKTGRQENLQYYLKVVSRCSQNGVICYSSLNIFDNLNIF